MLQEPINQQKILITGGTSGLGLELVKLFLKKGYYVIATGRQQISMTGYEDSFKLFRVDFSNLKQVAISTKEICESNKINVVINNAGILSPPDFILTADGFEYTFQVNFLSHLLINEIILCRIRDDNSIKIASVTSLFYRLADSTLSIPSGMKGYGAMKVYSSSKLYLTLMCEFFPARYPGLNLHYFIFDPGTFSSGIYRMQKSWFRKMYHIASPLMRKPVKVAKVLAEILINDRVSYGMICDFRKRLRPIPIASELEKEAFRIACYKIIDPYLK